MQRRFVMLTALSTSAASWREAWGTWPTRRGLQCRAGAVVWPVDAQRQPTTHGPAPRQCGPFGNPQHLVFSQNSPAFKTHFPADVKRMADVVEHT